MNPLKKLSSMFPVLATSMVALTCAVAMTACGGGGGQGSGNDIMTVAPAKAIPSPVNPALAPEKVVGVSIQATAAPMLEHGLVTTVVPPTYAVGTSARGAWDTLNTQRSACGFGLLQQDMQLDAASFAHAQYLVKNSIETGVWMATHDESLAGFKYFTGLTPDARAKVQGFTFSVSEVISSLSVVYPSTHAQVMLDDEALGANQMGGLISTIYHGRAVFGSGRRAGIGSDFETGGTIYKGLSTAKYSLVSEIANEPLEQQQKFGLGNVATYPCNGLSGVRSTFKPATELPNPFPDITDVAVLYGTPVFFKVDEGSNLRVLEAEITRESTQSLVGFRILAGHNDPHFVIPANEAFLVPTTALALNEKYTVNAVISVNGVIVKKIFTFKTEETLAKINTLM